MRRAADRHHDSLLRVREGEGAEEVPLRVQDEVDAAGGDGVCEACRGLVVDDLVHEAREVLLYERELLRRDGRDHPADAIVVLQQLDGDGAGGAEGSGHEHRLAFQAIRDAVFAQESQTRLDALVGCHRESGQGSGVLVRQSSGLG